MGKKKKRVEIFCKTQIKVVQYSSGMDNGVPESLQEEENEDQNRNQEGRGRVRERVRGRYLYRTGGVRIIWTK